MKRILSLTLVFLILLSSASVLANGDMASKLEGHWSKDLLDRDFVSYYFSYLAQNNFERLNPIGNISKSDFSLSLASLAKDYNLDSVSNNLIHGEQIKRTEIANIIGEKLNNIKGISKSNSKLPFKDISNLDNKSVESLKLLYNLKIINGITKDKFAPNRLVSQAEAIVILQRVKSLLDGIKEIDFEIKGVVQSFNSQENIIVKERDDNVLVTITKQFATPGYLLAVEKITKENGDYKVLLEIGPPAKDSILPQVITYKTITIEIDKAELSSKPPYNFIVE
ncbi:MAG TPA: S-layer homology domain-containing protein [Tissierellaceae bacterium]|nr:S-layer homology domain-containing protein [Tissierellaceae bacterium]